MIEITTLVLGPVDTNTYLVINQETKEAVVVDPAWDGGDIVIKAGLLGYTISQIWVTHAHFDHIGGVKAVSQSTVPPIEVAMHPDELGLWRAGGGAAFFGYQLDTSTEPSLLLRSGQSLTLGKDTFEVRHVPGHTQGHVAFYCAEAGVLFCGDLIFRAGVGRTDLPGGDFDTLIQSIRTQIFTLPDDVRILPGHGPETTVGYEKQNNPFL